MSDHDEVASGSGYNTPVPELDDHRHQISSAQKVDRPRRGTVDTLYGSRQHLQPAAPYSPSDVRVRDFEEAVLDEDDEGVSPLTPHSRRPTFNSTNEQQRAVSPPNSVKAFAEARRRERALSITDVRAQKSDEGEALQRTCSSTSRNSRVSQRSGRSRPGTFLADDGASLATNKTAEDDVCFPVQEEHRRDQLHIDFDYLENFIASENAARKESFDAQEAVRVFPNLRQNSVTPPPPMITVDGDFINIPSGLSDVDHEKMPQAPEIQEATPKPIDKEHLDPNRFSFFSSAWESTIHAAEFGDLVLPGEDLRGLFTLPRDEPDGVWWLNVNRPSEEEVRALCKAFGVHPLTIEDITTQEPREKIEIFPSYYFASFRSFNVVQDDDGPDYEPYNIYVVVFREGTLSFSFLPNTHASLVRKRISSLKDYVSLSSDWICYALIDNIVDSFAPAIDRVESLTMSIEDSIFVARPTDNNLFLRKLGNVRKNTLALMRGLGGKADILKGFTKRCNEDYKVTPRMDIGMYLGDIQDHVVTMMTNLTHFEKILSRAHSNYIAQLTMDSITQGTETNAGLSKITFLATIIVPLNVVTGLFGMNVHVPFQDDENITAFLVILGCLIFFCTTCLIIARRIRLI
ncbi:putative metal ion transporter C27B12.12c [Daldinia childiae]|uniref:putative metal ion transporter C27B12.12c n=1 Tax=Daldinia childiae TaxID=326645 RepID=UPI0014460727|nr:putative metal ion transporter C27B12.12c [Daldinia childiae]KAF3059941.1 putative metal ion transporter C27B12.12c [Daldinia childiae]